MELFVFSRNFGHQKALKAGYDHAFGDCVICMDADLQHLQRLFRINSEMARGL
ncbi:MAG: glycosyltransferase [Leptospiraceae bacterium]|nr:glycosyltransferase [Leptospiraceae bacterium]